MHHGAAANFLHDAGQLLYSIMQIDGQEAHSLFFDLGDVPVSLLLPTCGGN
jgi:hypothetical protein